ncbi:carbohydrate porin [Carboxylicivirga sp. A043]|uniref:carbohydrate porin n=1 Tax=Carboxylicivirga litoralis TaxID=2816963 RepID=UPI0021CB6DE3|nr:carbohydrate porin [Carboxylicivirga sp. A043]MCU4155158.1 carbohydrate porin [Carboxylicivirga sp. A043]
MKIKSISVFVLCLLSFTSSAQIAYERITNKSFSLGSYGRAGVDWSAENSGSIGRRLNLNNMGSIGGRMEEQDYMELVPAFHFKPVGDNNPTNIHVQMRLSAFSKDLTHIAYTSTASNLTLVMPELFAEAENIGGSGWTIWIGARLYRGTDIHIADHFYFNDHSGQGVGFEYKKMRFGGLFIASTDTTTTYPPYFYINIATGTASAELRQRVKVFFEYDFHLNEQNTLTALSEIHFMSAAQDEEDAEELPDEIDYPRDYGYVIGGRLKSDIDLFGGVTNQFAARLGKGIANGGDGGLSNTHLTFGAPNLENKNFRKAYSVSIVNDLFIKHNENTSTSAYLIYTNSKGAADTNGEAPSYYGKTVPFNKKVDFAIGARNSYAFSNYFKLLTDLHYSQRKDGDNPWASVTKLSLAPTICPTGEKGFWARPELRFVASFAYYNDFASEALYSPYLQVVGNRRFGHYFGFKMEWWIWN